MARFVLPHSVLGGGDTLAGTAAAFAEIARGTGTVVEPVTVLPVEPDTIQLTITVDQPSVNQAVTLTVAIDTPTVLTASLVTPDSIEIGASIDAPVTGTIVAPASIALSVSLAAASQTTDPNPTTVTAIVSLVRPAIHVSISGIISASPRWQFRDVTTGETQEFDINPNEETYNAFSKKIVYQNTLPNKSVIFETQQDASTLSWAGTILSQAELASFQRWFDNRSVIELTDDLGRIFMLYITEFTPKRERRASHPWFHTYNMQAYVFSEA